MLSGQASQTLLVASIMRARHQLLDAPVILNDPVVLDLVRKRATLECFLYLAIPLSQWRL
jgi:O-methyltransferase involved in polyketide biosynthesis